MLHRPDTPHRGEILTDTQWRRLIEAANRAHAGKEYERARKLYDLALAEARRLFSAAHRTEVLGPVAVIYVISCHNRADLARIEHDTTLARTLAEDGFECMVGTAENPAVPIVLRAGAVQNLGKALAYLAEMACEDKAVAAEMADHVVRARHAALTVLKVAQHSDAPAMAGDCAAALTMLCDPTSTR